MNSPLSLLMATALTFCSPVYALVISSLPPSENHPAVCELIIHPRGSDEASHCSGTLIAGDLVLTAAHCVSHEVDTLSTDIIVHCPNEPSPLGGVMAVHPLPFSLHNGTDFALIKLVRSASATPPMAVSVDSRTTQMALQGKCFLAGYGYGLIQGRHSSSPLNTAEIGELSLELDKNNDPCVVSRDPNTQAIFGDSGGSLYCLLPDERFVLIGVTSAIASKAKREIFAQDGGLITQKHDSFFGPTTSIGFALRNPEPVFAHAERSLLQRTRINLHQIQKSRDSNVSAVLKAIRSGATTVKIKGGKGAAISVKIPEYLRRFGRSISLDQYLPEFNSAQENWRVSRYIQGIIQITMGQATAGLRRASR